MATYPDPDRLYVIFSDISSYLPAFILLIPIIFQVVGILGIIWYIFAIIRYSSFKYQFPGLVKSVVIFLVGLLMEMLLPIS